MGHLLKTLHILRKRKDTLAEAAICSEAASGGTDQGVTVLLIQDAVLGNPVVPVPVYVSIQDLQARGATQPYTASEDQALPVRPPKAERGVGASEDAQRAPHGPPHIIVNYDQICQMILDHDRTIVW
jgi:sulfur transfer complex TusBCD TusB component (DsrH family)